MMENPDNTKGHKTPLPEETEPADGITPDDDLADVSELDPDELIHQKTEPPTEENIQQDADDAIHRAYKPPIDPTHENEERDPDDLSHGRI